MATSNQGSLQATMAARKKLIEAHQEEYNGYLGDEREARGLPRSSEADPRVKLQTKLARLQAQQADIEKQLAEIR